MQKLLGDYSDNTVYLSDPPTMDVVLLKTEIQIILCPNTVTVYPYSVLSQKNLLNEEVFTQLHVSAGPLNCM